MDEISQTLKKKKKDIERKVTQYIGHSVWIQRYIFFNFRGLNNISCMLFFLLILIYLRQVIKSKYYSSSYLYLPVSLLYHWLQPLHDGLTLPRLLVRSLQLLLLLT